ncbi:MAG: hypothetical protein Kow0069_17490 [Promethearchaeota archaeon]
MIDLQLDEGLREKLEDEFPFYHSRVDNPWQDFPDLEEFNQRAFKKLERQIKKIIKDRQHQSLGCAIKGPPGTGKTHLLMRVVKKKSKTNHVMFVRRLSNPDTVTQDIWTAVIRSLLKPLPGEGEDGGCQLDEFLSHVLIEMLIQGLRRKIDKISLDPDKLARARSLIGFLEEIQRDKERGISALKNQRDDRLRNIIENELKSKHPEVEISVVRGFLKFFYYQDANYRRDLRLWFEGQLDDDPERVKRLGLQPWIGSTLTEEMDLLQMKEQAAEKAMHTLSLMSLYSDYPLILCFDQLEGLRHQPELIHKFTDAVREIFTRCSNLLVVTCVFPDMWDVINENSDLSYAHRAGQVQIDLESLTPDLARKLISLRLGKIYREAGIETKTDIYPFEDADVEPLLYVEREGRREAVSVREFINRCNDAWESWLDGEILEELDHADKVPTEIQPEVPTEAEPSEAIGPEDQRTPRRLNEPIRRREINVYLESVYSAALQEQQFQVRADIPNAERLFNTIVGIVSFLISRSGSKVSESRVTLGKRVFPLNRVYGRFCLALVNVQGNSFTAQVRNLVETFHHGAFDAVVVVRDSRVGDFPAKRTKGAEHLEKLTKVTWRGAAVLLHEGDVAVLDTIFSMINDARNQDLQIRSHPINQDELYKWLVDAGHLLDTELFSILETIEGIEFLPEGFFEPSGIEELEPESGLEAETSEGGVGVDVAKIKPAPSDPKAGPPVQPEPDDKYVVLGSKRADSMRLGLIGTLPRMKRRVALSLEEQLCMMLVGTMGSGKSYAVGTIIENMVLPQSHVVRQGKAGAAVVFNYRADYSARFEYGSFLLPNDRTDEIGPLREAYGLSPAAVENLNVVTFEVNVTRNAGQYGRANVYRLTFKPEELEAQSWLLLMRRSQYSSQYLEFISDLLGDLDVEGRLTLENIREEVEQSESLNNNQKRLASQCLVFAERFIRSEREFEWSDLLTPGSVTIFDLRSRMHKQKEVFILFLVIMSIIRNQAKDVSKLIVFDEAHEYMNSKAKALIEELSKSIRLMRHEDISYVIATQSPEDIPHELFKHFNVRFLFKIIDKMSFNHIKKHLSNLGEVTPERVAALRGSSGMCYLLCDTDKVSSQLLRTPQLFQFRPRMTLHGGFTVTHVEEAGAQSIEGGAAAIADAAPTPEAVGETDQAVKVLTELPEGLEEDPLYARWREFESSFAGHRETIENSIRKALEHLEREAGDEVRAALRESLEQLASILARLQELPEVDSGDSEAAWEAVDQLQSLAREARRQQEAVNEAIRAIAGSSPAVGAPDEASLREIMRVRKRDADIRRMQVEVFDDLVNLVVPDRLPRVGKLLAAEAGGGRYLVVPRDGDAELARIEAERLGAAIVMEVEGGGAP